MNEQKAEEIEKGSISSLHASGQFDSWMKTHVYHKKMMQKEPFRDICAD